MTRVRDANVANRGGFTVRVTRAIHSDNYNIDEFVVGISKGTNAKVIVKHFASCECLRVPRVKGVISLWNKYVDP